VNTAINVLKEETPHSVSTLSSDILSLSICHGGCKDTALESWTPGYDELVNTLSNPNIGEKDGTYFLRCAGTKRGNDSTADTADIIILDGDSRIDFGGEIISGAPNPKLVHKCLTNLVVCHFKTK